MSKILIIFSLYLSPSLSPKISSPHSSQIMPRQILYSAARVRDYPFTNLRHYTGDESLITACAIARKLDTGFGTAAHVRQLSGLLGAEQREVKADGSPTAFTGRTLASAHSPSCLLLPVTPVAIRYGREFAVGRKRWGAGRQGMRYRNDNRGALM